MPDLLSTLGPLVDALYPQGTAKLLLRLERALDLRDDAFVAASQRTGRPIALAAECSKGNHTRKLSTFWVHPLARRRGVGRELLGRRMGDWARMNEEQVHVTVREERSAELERVLLPSGFSRVSLELNRYGEGRNEAVYVWRTQAAYVDTLAS